MLKTFLIKLDFWFTWNPIFWDVYHTKVTTIAQHGFLNYSISMNNNESLSKKQVVYFAFEVWCIHNNIDLFEMPYVLPKPIQKAIKNLCLSNEDFLKICSEHGFKFEYETEHGFRKNLRPNYLLAK